MRMDPPRAESGTGCRTRRAHGQRVHTRHRQGGRNAEHTHERTKPQTFVA
jgi:hypothetical protein